MMEEGTETSVVPAAPLHLEVLRLIRDYRQQRGLRHTNYLRYHRFCSARLKRLRRGTELTNIQRKGQKFQKRPTDVASLKPPQLRDPRILELPLVLAERAWSHAMELREQNITEQNRRVHLHIIRKLRRADREAARFLALATSLADHRTALEAEAYAAVMAALLDLELSHWPAGLEKLSRAKFIYQELAKRAEAEIAEICHTRISEIDLSIRYCRFNMGEKSTEAEVADLSMSSQNAATMSALYDRFEAMLASESAGPDESRSLTLSSGETVRVKSETIRLPLIEAQKVQADINRLRGTPGQLERTMELFDQLFVRYNDAQQAIAREVQLLQEKGANLSSKQNSQISELEKLLGSVKILRLQQTLQRNRVMIDDLVARQSPPRDIVRIFDTVIQNIRDLQALASPDDTENNNQLAARLLLARATRCSYMAEDYASQGKFSELMSLVTHANGYCSTAEQHIASCQTVDPLLVQELAKLKAALNRRLLCLRAELAVQQLSSQGFDQLEQPTTHDFDPDIFSYSFAEGPRFAPIPPPLETMPCKPQLFDLVLPLIELPNLEARTKAQKRGWFGLW
jgi:signal recognition particle subunit SRP68